MEGREERIKRLNKLQDKAADIASDHQHAVLQMATGAGKTISAYKYLYKLLEKGKINLGDTVCIMSEVRIRFQNVFLPDAKKFTEK